MYADGSKVKECDDDLTMKKRGGMIFFEEDETRNILFVDLALVACRAFCFETRRGGFEK